MVADRTKMIQLTIRNALKQHGGIEPVLANGSRLQRGALDTPRAQARPATAPTGSRNQPRPPSAHSRSDGLAELEALLVQKVSERGSTLHGALKRVLRQFDSDSSGELDAAELACALKVFLPGIADDEIEGLAALYDADGNGAISIEELTLRFMRVEKGNATLPSSVKNARPAASSPSGVGKRNSESRRSSEGLGRPLSTVGSELSGPKMPKKPVGTFEKRLNAFQSTLRARLLSEASLRRLTLPKDKRLGAHTSALAEEGARAALAAAFQRRLGKPQQAQEGAKLGLRQFAAAIEDLRAPGQMSLSSPDIAALWQLCFEGDYRPFVESTFMRREEVAPNRFGFQQVIAKPTAPPAQEVGSGPFKPLPEKTGATNEETLKALASIVVPQRIRYRHCKTTVAAPAAWDAAADIARSSRLPDAALTLEHVHGFRAYAGDGPNLYFTRAAFANSAVNGNGNGHSSGDSERASLAGGAIVYTVAATVVVQEVPQRAENTERQQRRASSGPAAAAVTAAVAAGCRQMHFLGHTDDISALALSPDGETAATGQLGKRPFVLVWSVRDCSLIRRLGDGFFERGVCAICFSSDGALLAAIGQDDHHLMGIFDLRTGALLADAPAQNGPPPQITALVWAPCQSSPSAGNDSNEALVSIGHSRHLKFWTFDRKSAEISAARRPDPSGNPKAAVTAAAPGALTGRLGVFGPKVEQPRRLYSCCYVSTGAASGGTRSADGGSGGNARRRSSTSAGNSPVTLLTGADNGLVYVWHGSRCTGVVQAHHGPVYALAAYRGDSGDRNGSSWASGGADGVVRSWIGTEDAVLRDSATLPVILDSGAAARVRTGVTAHEEAQQSLFTVVRKAKVAKAATAAFAKTQGAPAWKAAPLLNGGAAKTLGAAAAATLGRRGIGGSGAAAAADVPAAGMPTYQAPEVHSVGGVAAAIDLAVGSGGELIVATDRAAVYALSHCGRNDSSALSGNNERDRRGRGATPAAQGKPTAIAGAGAGAAGGGVAWTALVHGHFAAAQGLAAHPFDPHVFFTAGEDAVLMKWNSATKQLTAATSLPAAARSVAVSPDAKHVAVGLRNGAVAVFSGGNLAPLTRWRHCKEDIDDLKYSPDGRSLAVASHDNYVDLYDVRVGTAALAAAATGAAARNARAVTGTAKGTDAGGNSVFYRHRGRCRGHTSYVTHVDWSADSRLLQSTCGANELLYWDAAAAKQVRSTGDTVEADTKWSTYTCTFGFPVMGIWPPNSDGTDVNALQRSADGQFLVTGDDFGGVKLFACPSVVHNAPAHRYLGHSAHVMNARFLAGDRRVVTIGGNDRGVLVWRFRRCANGSGGHGGRTGGLEAHGDIAEPRQAWR